MSQSLVILGRQPALGLAELESLYGADKIRPVGDSAALLDTHHSEVAFDRLGGSLKLTKLLHSFPETHWKTIENYLVENLPKHLPSTSDGKLTIGLSVFGLPTSNKQLLATGLTVKKALRGHGKSVRLVPNKAPALNSAQVIHNKLFGANGWELVFVKDGQQVLMCLTVKEQDIEAYTARDQERPKRDSKVGMLPPKLAQIIVNLAGNHVPPTGATITSDSEPRRSRLLDPFCGTGVILQEALLMGYDVIGADLEPRMVEYSTANLDWLAQRLATVGTVGLETGDATTISWPPFDLIACETYLGRPFSQEPDPQTLQKVMQDVETIHKKFLRNVAEQTKSGFRMCIAVPAWHTRSGVKHLKALDSLEELGYNRMSFVHASDKDLVYHREGQVVGRELVVLVRK
jgi:tRNA G10  N-methylase Trm11